MSISELTTTGNNFILNTQFLNPIVSLFPALASQTILASQSGSTFSLPQCTIATTITLPAVTAGFNCRVFLSAVPDGTHTVTFAGPSTKMSGVHSGVAAGLVSTSAAGVSNLILGATAANIKVGDYIDFWSDGNIMYFKAWSSGTADAYTTS